MSIYAAVEALESKTCPSFAFLDALLFSSKSSLAYSLGARKRFGTSRCIWNGVSPPAEPMESLIWTRLEPAPFVRMDTHSIIVLLRTTFAAPKCAWLCVSFLSTIELGIQTERESIARDERRRSRGKGLESQGFEKKNICPGPQHFEWSFASDPARPTRRTNTPVIAVFFF